MWVPANIQRKRAFPFATRSNTNQRGAATIRRPCPPKQLPAPWNLQTNTIQMAHARLISLVEYEVLEALHRRRQAVVVQVVVQPARRSDQNVRPGVGAEASEVCLDVGPAHDAQETHVMESLPETGSSGVGSGGTRMDIVGVQPQVSQGSRASLASVEHTRFLLHCKQPRMASASSPHTSRRENLSKNLTQ